MNRFHPVLNRTVNDGSVSKYKLPRCSHCSSIVESNSLLRTTTSASFSVREKFTCTSSDEIYLITCKKCNIQYVGQSQQKCSQRMNKHKFVMKQFPDINTTVPEHFNSPGYSIKSFSFMPIDKVTGNWIKGL